MSSNSDAPPSRAKKCIAASGAFLIGACFGTGDGLTYMIYIIIL